MKTALALLLALLAPIAGAACDKVDAAKVQLALAEAGAWWSERGGAVTLEWGWAWDGARPAQRLQLMRTFAQGDACLAGAVRPISFFRQGRLVGTASASGVQLVPLPVTSAGGSARAADCH